MRYIHRHFSYQGEPWAINQYFTDIDETGVEVASGRTWQGKGWAGRPSTYGEDTEVHETSSEPGKFYPCGTAYETGSEPARAGHGRVAAA
jgi:hypothetical protein